MTDDIDPRFLAIIKSLEVKHNDIKSRGVRYDDNDRSWAEETELLKEIPLRVRVSALETAWIPWGKQARRIEDANRKKQTWKGWRG